MLNLESLQKLVLFFFQSWRKHTEYDLDIIFVSFPYGNLVKHIICCYISPLVINKYGYNICSSMYVVSLVIYIHLAKKCIVFLFHAVHVKKKMGRFLKFLLIKKSVYIFCELSVIFNFVINS